MGIDIVCECGWKARIKDEFSGKKVKCKECQSVIDVPFVPELIEEDDQPEPPAEKPEPRERDDTPPPPPAPKRFADTPIKKRRGPKIEYRTRERDEPRGGGFVLSGAAIGSLGSILLGIILVSLAANSSRGRVSIYGIVLIVLGIIGFIRALMGAGEE